MRNICIDSGFLFALYDEKDSQHDKATQYFKDYFEGKPNSFLIAWPILYETVNTKFVKNRQTAMGFMQDWLKLTSEKKLILYDDTSLRNVAIEEYHNELRTSKQFPQQRNLSLVDRIIRGMLLETNLKIAGLITFNPGDFSDICKRIQCELIN